MQSLAASLTRMNPPVPTSDASQDPAETNNGLNTGEMAAFAPLLAAMGGLVTPAPASSPDTTVQEMPDMSRPASGNPSGITGGKILPVALPQSGQAGPEFGQDVSQTPNRARALKLLSAALPTFTAATASSPSIVLPVDAPSRATKLRTPADQAGTAPILAMRTTVGAAFPVTAQGGPAAPAKHLPIDRQAPPASANPAPPPSPPARGGTQEPEADTGHATPDISSDAAGRPSPAGQARPSADPFALTPDVLAPVQTPTSTTAPNHVPAQQAALPGGTERFGELVEAIAQARESGSGHFVRTTVSHADFGLVAMALRKDESGLNAVLTNPSPDFVAAVHASAQAQGGSEPRGDASHRPALADRPLPEPSHGSSQNDRPAQQDGRQFAHGSAATRRSGDDTTGRDAQPHAETPAATHRGIMA